MARLKYVGLVPIVLSDHVWGDDIVRVGRVKVDDTRAGTSPTVQPGDIIETADGAREIVSGLFEIAKPLRTPAPAQASTDKETAL